MSRLAEQLRAITIYNNWKILLQFGSEMDVAIEYRRPPDGRLGWCECYETRVWSPRVNPKLENPRHAMTRGTERVFLGLRKESLPAAIAWASAEFGHEYVPSPFGGYIPKHVRHKAICAAKAGSLPPVTGATNAA